MLYLDLTIYFRPLITWPNLWIISVCVRAHKKRKLEPGSDRCRNWY